MVQSNGGDEPFFGSIRPPSAKSVGSDVRWSRQVCAPHSPGTVLFHLFVLTLFCQLQKAVDAHSVFDLLRLTSTELGRRDAPALQRQNSASGQIESVPLASLLAEPATFLFYFSASWCKPCQGFTPLRTDKRFATPPCGQFFSLYGSRR